MNKIGLTKLSDNSFEITPCEIQFQGFSVALGNGIKRAFPSINTKFSSPCNKYIEQFLIPEMKSVFQFDESEDNLFSTKFIQNFNNFASRHSYFSQEHESKEGIKFRYVDGGFQFVGIKLSTEESLQLDNIAQSFEPFLNKIDIIGQSGLSRQIKLDLFVIVYQTTITFINDLLKETNQTNSSYNTIESRIHLEQKLLETESTLSKLSNNFRRNSFDCLMIARILASVLGLIFLICVITPVIRHIISRT